MLYFFFFLTVRSLRRIGFFPDSVVFSFQKAFGLALFAFVRVASFQVCASLFSFLFACLHFISCPKSRFDPRDLIPVGWGGV